MNNGVKERKACSLLASFHFSVSHFIVLALPFPLLHHFYCLVSSPIRPISHFRFSPFFSLFYLLSCAFRQSLPLALFFFFFFFALRCNCGAAIWPYKVWLHHTQEHVDRQGGEVFPGLECNQTPHSCVSHRHIQYGHNTHILSRVRFAI